MTLKTRAVKSIFKKLRRYPRHTFLSPFNSEIVMQLFKVKDMFVIFNPIKVPVYITKLSYYL